MKTKEQTEERKIINELRATVGGWLRVVQEEFDKLNVGVTRLHTDEDGTPRSLDLRIDGTTFSEAIRVRWRPQRVGKWLNNHLNGRALVTVTARGIDKTWSWSPEKLDAQKVLAYVKPKIDEIKEESRRDRDERDRRAAAGRLERKLEDRFAGHGFSISVTPEHSITVEVHGLSMAQLEGIANAVYDYQDRN